MPPKSKHADVIQSWVEAQRQLWETWVGAMQQAGGGMPRPDGATPSQLLGRTLDTWEPFVRQTLEAQAKAMDAWVETFNTTPNMPEQIRTQVEQLQKLTRGWLETEHQLWDAMFGVARQFAAAAESQTERHTSASQVPGAEVWQQLAQPALEAQAAWLRQWSTILSKPR
jgi:hypothetical protein